MSDPDQVWQDSYQKIHMLLIHKYIALYFKVILSI
jgi:hypothetical protein